MSEPNPQDFRTAMRSFVGNCSLITTGTGLNATGLIVTSAISLSAEPPLMLACVNRSSASYPVLRDEGYFALSSLGAAHQAIAERFSGFSGVKGVARYEGADWETAVTGAQLLVGAPAGAGGLAYSMMAKGSKKRLKLGAASASDSASKPRLTKRSSDEE